MMLYKIRAGWWWSSLVRERSDLIDDRVTHAGGVAASRATLTRNRVHLVQDDDVERRCVTRRRPLSLCGSKELAHTLLRLPPAYGMPRHARHTR